MQPLVKSLLIIFLMANNFLNVQIFGEGCSLEATYQAERVYINADEAYMNLELVDGQRLHVPFRYGIHEVQVSFGQYFRSYTYDGNKVKEGRTPVCKGAI
jgi:hypothetical protein